MSLPFIYNRHSRTQRIELSELKNIYRREDVIYYIERLSGDRLSIQAMTDDRDKRADPFYASRAMITYSQSSEELVYSEYVSKANRAYFVVLGNSQIDFVSYG